MKVVLWCIRVIEIDLLVWLRARFERAKYLFKDRNSLVYSTKLARFTATLKPLCTKLSGSKQSWYSVITAQSAAVRLVDLIQLGASESLLPAWFARLSSRDTRLIWCSA